MRLCVPTDTADGLTAPVSNHFGRAPWFTLVDTETGTVESIPNTWHEAGQGGGHGHGHGCGHGHGQVHGQGLGHGHGVGRGGGQALNVLLGHSFDAVACRHIGAGATTRLKEAGIGLLTCEAGSVADAIALARGRN